MSVTTGGKQKTKNRQESQIQKSCVRYYGYGDQTDDPALTLVTETTLDEGTEWRHIQIKSMWKPGDREKREILTASGGQDGMCRDRDKGVVSWWWY